MLRTVNWLARGLGYAADGLLTFLNPPHGGHGEPLPHEVTVQIIAYALLGLSLLAWLLLDLRVARGKQRGPWFPVTLGVMAVASGVGCTTGGGGVSMVAFAIVAALVAGSSTGTGTALAVTAAGILATEVSGLAFGDSLGGLLGFPALYVSGLLVGRNIGSYRVQAEQSTLLLAQREQLEAEQRRADLLDERARIAREIHDVLAHSLGALGIQIQAARAVLTDDADIDRAGQILASAQRMAAEGLTETRRAVHALRADMLPLDEELAKVSETFAERYHVEASFARSGEPAPLPPDATVALLRVAQEAMVNAAKHAAGKRVEVQLDYGGSDVLLTVRNDLSPDSHPNGTGLRTVNSGYGLIGMRERLRLLNGTLEAGKLDGQWVVTAQLPRPPAEAS